LWNYLELEQIPLGHIPSKPMDISQLNQDFGIPGSLSFSEKVSGFPLIEITNDCATALISLYGGHVMAFKPVGAAQDLLYFSDSAVFKMGKALRGGIPICWPWFGGHPTETSKPSHGVARNMMWQVSSTETTTTGATRVILTLTDTPDTRQVWDYGFELAIAITVGTTLDLELITRNTGEKAFEITQALHTYFNIGDVQQVKVLGLDGCNYIDKVDGEQVKTQLGEVAIAAEVDRVYMGAPTELTVADPALGRKIRITSKNSTTAIVWNPWIDKAIAMGDLGDNDYQRMICVETANAAQEIITVQPQSDFRLGVSYSSENL
jgi:glucose-6-phosphate 1-epimerase